MNTLFKLSQTSNTTWAIEQQTSNTLPVTKSWWRSLLPFFPGRDVYVPIWKDIGVVEKMDDVYKCTLSDNHQFSVKELNQIIPFLEFYLGQTL